MIKPVFKYCMRSTQPGHPFVGRRNKYQPKGDDNLQRARKGMYDLCVGGSVILLLYAGHI